jgi:DNA-binding NarL/FixJ family response regulator
MKTKLLIVCEDETRVRHLGDAIAQDTASGIVVFTTTCLPDLQAGASSIQPDVLLIEHSALGDRAQQVLLSLVSRAPGTRILFLCDSCPRELMLAFIRLGACGCILDSDPPALVIKAVQSVHKGDTWFGRSSLMLAVRSMVGTAPVLPPRDDKERLTAREEEIFNLIGRGLTNKEIARQLDISDHTVKTHLHRVYVKLEQSGRYKVLLSQPCRLPH